MNIETQRLRLTPVEPADGDALLELFRDASVRRYLLDDQLVVGAWVAHEIRASAARFAGGSLGLWSVRPKNGRKLIGFVGFREFFEPPELQLLYGLLPAWWGQGLATEAARAACAYAFDEVGLAELRAATDVPNTSSARVLTRLGFSLTRTTEEGAHGTQFFVLPRGRPGQMVGRREAMSWQTS